LPLLDPEKNIEKGSGKTKALGKKAGGGAPHKKIRRRHGRQVEREKKKEPKKSYDGRVGWLCGGGKRSKKIRILYETETVDN